MSNTYSGFDGKLLLFPTDEELQIAADLLEDEGLTVVADYLRHAKQQIPVIGTTVFAGSGAGVRDEPQITHFCEAHEFGYNRRCIHCGIWDIDYYYMKYGPDCS